MGCRIALLGIMIKLVIFLISAAEWAEASVCAQVKIEIRQELTLERQAFDAHMRIANGLTHVSLENVDIDVTFLDEDGGSVLATTDPDNETALFFIRLDSMGGIDDVDGGGVVAADSVADIHWLIIPAQGASNGVGQGTLYYVGAKLAYTIGGEEHVTEVTPDYIFVKPMPDLTLDYFLPNDVYGDDPFTAEIEAAIPFSMGVRVLNSGQGTAKALKIDSARPRIVENEQGLLVDFQILGSEVNGGPEVSSLLVDFGDIEPGSAGTARWTMSCSVYGQFVEFNAAFSHSDELGGELTSLVSDVNTHFLVRDVLVDLPGRDGVRDFLAKDGSFYTAYESDAVDTQVTDQSASASLTLDGTDGSEVRYILAMPQTDGPVVVKLDDPFSGANVIKSALRSDGKQLSLDNVWLSKTREDNNPWQYYFYLFDVNTPGTYTIVFEDSTVQPQPPVLQFIPDRQRVEGERLSFVVEASDPNGTTPRLSASPLPAGATFEDNGDGTGLFDWTPAVWQAGMYQITFVASDGVLEDSQTPRITICTADDSDCDGMDDQWEQDHFGTLDRDGTGDYDGDGVSDLDEFLNGTDPADAAVVYLKQGFNLIAIPDAAAGENLKDRIADLGDSQSVEKVMVFDKLDDSFVTMVPGEIDNPDYNLEGGEALIVHALADREVLFGEKICEPVDLQAGFNLVGLTCAPYGYTARQFLQELGADKVASIQRYDTEQGKFETVGFDEDGEMQGADFPIVPGEGYFVHMKTAYSGFEF